MRLMKLWGERRRRVQVEGCGGQWEIDDCCRDAGVLARARAGTELGEARTLARAKWGHRT
jgi:hypothetical protein